jgi:carboxymethylenebutenolidase
MFRGQIATVPEHAERLSSEGDAGGADTIAWAAIDRLAQELGPDAPLATLGWSFGAAYAVWAPSERDRVKAAVLYYGTYTDDFIKGSDAPVLAHFAEEDPFTTDDEIREFDEAMRGAGRELTIHRYPGTGHWFAEPSRDAYRPEAAELAYERTLAFLRDTLAAR